MNRTDRLYALVEELRAVAPRPRSAAWLARRYEVSTRTIERDLEALRQSGVPIWAENGRTGGYTLDRERTLAPLALTATEALAVSLALRSVADAPFGEAARSAGQKVLGSLPDDVRRREQSLVDRVHRVGEHAPAVSAKVRRAVEQSVVEGRVVHLGYQSRPEDRTERDVEPMGLLWGPAGWYLLGWCRLRDDVRGFLLGRIVEARLTDEAAPDRTDETRRELERLSAERVTE